MENVTSIFVTHDLLAASIIASEYALAENGNIRYITGVESPHLASIKFIMLLDGEICFSGRYKELKNSEVPYVKSFVQ